jgi:hypothetical protein
MDALVFREIGVIVSHHARRAVLAFLIFCSTLLAQQAARPATQELNNDSVIKLTRAGLSDELIISTINSLPGTYDTSPDGLIALKKAGASDKVAAAIVVRATSVPDVKTTLVAPVADAATTAAPQSLGIASSEEPTQRLLPASGGQNGAVLVAEVPRASTASVPRVFLQSASKGTNRNAARDQSMEMSKDMERDCPGVQVTIIQQNANYTVLLNHIEAGFVRDNQIQVANKDGDLMSKTKEGGSIAAGMKKACALILADWAKR